MHVTTFEAGDRVQIITRSLEDGRLYGQEGVVQEIKGWPWPLNVLLDDSLETVPLDAEEVQRLESKEDAEIAALRSALREEERRTERFARETHDLREEKATSDLAAKLWQEACTKAETELAELKDALATLAR